jgi:hypothetical protein
MFEVLSERLSSVFKRLGGRGQLKESDIDAGGKTSTLGS